MRGSAAIVGGGIGGLTAAGALNALGWRVSVFERESGPSGAGTALGMWPSALAALDRIKVGDAVRAVAVAQVSARFVRDDGTNIATLNVERLRRRSGDPVYLISRPALLAQLRSVTGTAAMRFGAAVDDLGALRGSHDVVIVADGMFSGVRAELFGPRSRARYAGVTAWRGSIDAMTRDSLVECWGIGAKFGVTPQEDGRTNWYAAAFAAEGDFFPGDESSRLHERFGSWRGPVPPVLAAINEDGILRHDLYVVPRLPSYVRDNIALIGDAAHGMPPDLGRGACEAIVDSVVLARCLSEAAVVADGLRAYDSARRRVTQRLAAASSAASKLMRWSRALWLRDALMRASVLVPPPS